MADSVFSTPVRTESLAATGSEPVTIESRQPDLWSSVQLLKLFEEYKREAFEGRWILERDWMRDLYYLSGRMWIMYHPTRREWLDKRLQKWIPRPVTNKMAEVLDTIRANFAAVDLTPKVRPVGNDSKSIAAAEVADQLAPLIHEEHRMDDVMHEADFWLIGTGSVCLQVSWDLDERSNRIFIPYERCPICQWMGPSTDIAHNQNVCPECHTNKQFLPALDDQGQPQGIWKAFGKGKTSALSPFEYAFPQHYTRFEDIPYLFRLRWRDKHWFEANRPDLVHRITWEKNPHERSLQIFKSLSALGDLTQATQFAYLGLQTGQLSEGVTEYELWIKPTPQYPHGVVMRVIGDTNPMILEVPNEGIPGPIPYRDIEDNAIWPFVFCPYTQMGGRIYGRSAISPLIQKQDQLNQLDSLTQLIVQRMANPIWVVPKGAGVEHFTGEPGLVMFYDSLVGGQNAKPERVAGSEIPASIIAYRKQILDDIEQLAGTFDILKGHKPVGVEAFAALQLLVERSQSRFSAIYKARSNLYRDWFAIALELERQFGPHQRVMAVTTPNRGYTFKHFENAQLQGRVTILIEDGSTMPKTSLGRRAAIEQANQLGLINPTDPDQRYSLLTNYGLADLSPTLNAHVQRALEMQDRFEEWVLHQSEGPNPLEVKPWHDATIHWVERIKWLNSDRMKELLDQHPEAEPYIVQNLRDLQLVMLGTGGSSAPSPRNPQGSALALRNSNANATSLDVLPHGNQELGPTIGPA